MMDQKSKPNNNSNKRKQSMGRRKIEIKKIEKISSRQVAFSKRRSGLFRKASELCFLTGAEGVILVVSSKDKVFTFCHPTVESIINRYEQNINSYEGFDFSQSALLSETQENMNKLRLLEGERDRLKAMYQYNVVGTKGGIGNGKINEGYWWNNNTDGMGLEELEKFKHGLEELRKEVKKKADERVISGNERIEMHGGVMSVPHDFGFSFHNYV